MRDGLLLDVRGAAALLGTTERALRARVSRRVVPFRKFSGRIVFLRTELEQFLTNLPGCSLDEARENLALRSGEGVRR